MVAKYIRLYRQAQHLESISSWKDSVKHCLEEHSESCEFHAAGNAVLDEFTELRARGKKSALSGSMGGWPYYGFFFFLLPSRPVN
jgi:hypothetical protein